MLYKNKNLNLIKQLPDDLQDLVYKQFMYE